MKDYVARFGHGSAKLARQAQSKEKVLAKMVRGGLTARVKADHVVRGPPTSSNKHSAAEHLVGQAAPLRGRTALDSSGGRGPSGGAGRRSSAPGASCCQA